ncbi:MAG: aldehyde dehydrogenase, partial [Gemmiger sp.]
MEQQQIAALVERQRAFFETGVTLPVAYRLDALRRLRDAVRRREDDICEALRLDLGKSAAESYMCEVGMTCSEISYMLGHLRGFARQRRVLTPLAQFAARSYTQPGPYGVTLIMSPWNYPFMLTMEPLVDALAAGNTAVLKPSAYAPHTGEAIRRLVEECFDPAYVAVVTGGRAENGCLLGERFDHIFFTGSQSVGREVMRCAAERLTPVTLELGGKSPCLVDRTANLRLAARRIVFGKFLNCGQTCVAPDYLYCDAAVKDELVAAIRAEICRQFGEHPLQNPDYGRIINEKHFRRLRGLIDPAKVVWGGAADEAACRIEPTVMDNVGWQDAVMQEEIFGPVLPVLTFSTMEEAMAEINRRPHPLALYLFSEDRAQIPRVTGRCQFGGGCVNDVVIHLATSRMGFGGVGASGMGAYHGRAGF